MAKTVDRGPGPLGRLSEDASLGWGIAVAVITGTLLGMWLDNRWTPEPWGLVLGFLFGLAAAGRLVWRAHLRSQQ